MIADVRVFRTKERATESTGYEVALLDDRGNTVNEYSAGANPHCSQSPGISPTGTVKRWARQTAAEVFEERFGRRPRRGEIVLEVVRLDAL